MDGGLKWLSRGRVVGYSVDDVCLLIGESALAR